MPLRNASQAVAWPFIALLLTLVGAVDSTRAADPIRFDETTERALSWREVGPYRGGRCAAVAGIPRERETYYMGATGGGVWKTDDAGRTWRNVSDGSFGGSIGAVAVSEWDPNVVYVGGGEKTIRGNVSHGDGMWKSTDAGRTWKAIGLADSRHISRVRIHPKDPDTVYAAVMGHLFGPNEQRGVYRSKDGGASWQRILYVSDDAGAVDLVMDPTNPRILYASLWQMRRTPYRLDSGGEDSGIWKSTDGGDTWTEITRNPGLPRATIGISGIAVSASDPDNVYAIVEAEDGGVFRSRDGGATWSRTNSDRSLRQRAWYYTRIYTDPQDEDAVYVLNVQFHHSEDGGRTFRTIAVPHGDNHDLWIDPNDAQRMIQSNDGGANVSNDGGATWSAQDNQPTAQMYRVSVDNAFPYRLLGGQQDNSAVRIRSRSLASGSISVRDWEPTAGGESGHIVAKPDDPDIVFGGSYGGYLQMRNHRTGERRAVNVWPDNPMGAGAEAQRYRFQWNFPIFFSPHDPNTLYAAANVLFRSRDLGASWDAMSPDLTRDDPAKQASSGGPITQDNTGVEYYCTIFAALESPHERGVLWAGSDDGLIHVSRDDGATWTDVTPPDMPKWILVNSIEAHPFQKGGLYVAATMYKWDDFRPYLFATTDYGATWRRIDAGIPRDHFTRVVRADPDREGLLYAGTERGVHVSFDDGQSWSSLQLDLPIVPVTDLAVKDRDLVVATQGRGYWILDDLSVLHQLSEDVLDQPVHLFTPRATHRIATGRRRSGSAGTNPPSGVVLRYRLAEAPAADAEVTLEILDENGDVLRTFERAADADASPHPDVARYGSDPRSVEVEAGWNSFVWDLRHRNAERFPGMVLWNGGGLRGPRAIPGSYGARLTVGDTVSECSFELLADPRSETTAEQRAEWLDFSLSIRDTLDRTHAGIARVREVRDQLGTVRAKLDESAEDLNARIEAFLEDLGDIEKTLYQTKNRSRQDPLNFPIRLNDKLAGVQSLASQGDFAPTQGMHEVRDELTKQIDAQLETLATLLDDDLTEINRAIRNADVPAVAPSR